MSFLFISYNKHVDSKLVGSVKIMMSIEPNINLCIGSAFDKLSIIETVNKTEYRNDRKFSDRCA